MHVDKSVECLLCHTVQYESFAGNPGCSWQCKRCGQHWDAARVAAVMNYRRWLIAENEIVDRNAIA